MISVNEAEEIILKNIIKPQEEDCKFDQSYARIIAEDISSDRNYPPKDKVLMDGIAISYKAFQRGLKTFNVQGEQPAGAKPLTLESDQNCIEIMTGALLPVGSDTIVPVENVTINDGVATIVQGYQAGPAKHVQKEASQYKKGDVLIQKGRQCFAPQIAILASVGKSSVKVYKSIKVAIITTGDELKDVNASVSDYEIRKSNSYFIQAALENLAQCQSEVFHCKDDKHAIKETLTKSIDHFDCVVLTGGVSMGKYDYVPVVLNELDVKVCFHKVKQKPGKPLWFGRTKNQKNIFALPGNPISTQACLVRYVIKNIQQSMGTDVMIKTAQLAEDFAPDTQFTYFLPVSVLTDENGVCWASPKPFHGSSDIAGLANAAGFIEIPENTNIAKKGEVFPLYLWRNL